MSILLSTINQEWPSFLRCWLRRYAQYGNHTGLFLETETAIPQHMPPESQNQTLILVLRNIIPCPIKEDLTKAIEQSKLLITAQNINKYLYIIYKLKWLIHQLYN